MCFFSETSTSQRCNAVRLHKHTHTLTLTCTLTLSHTHMTGQPWIAGQVVPENFFFRVLQKKILTTSGQQEFFGSPGGHATYENIILREIIVSFCLC